jgi:hypothetical protein
MRRKTIIWIVAGVLVAALVAAVGIVSYHIGFNHGNVGVMRSGASQRGMMRNFAIGGGFARRDAGFPGLGLLAAVLLAGAVGAAIVYLIDPGRHSARAVAAGSTAGGTVAAGSVAAGFAPAPVAGAVAGGPADPQWQQFEQWHRQMHDPGAAQTQAAPPAVAAPEAPTVTAQPPVGATPGASISPQSETPPSAPPETPDTPTQS